MDVGVGPIRYTVDADMCHSFGFPGADEMGDMIPVCRDFEKEVTRTCGRVRVADAFDLLLILGESKSRLSTLLNARATGPRVVQSTDARTSS